MGKHGWLILVALWLAACTAAPTASPTPPATAMAQLPTATASPRPATATRLPTITPTPSRTATHTRPPTATATITPSPSNTFDPQATVATATPAPAAVCPTADPNASPSLDFLTPPDGFYELGNSDSYQQQALDYLNLAGPDGIRLAMAAQGKIEGVDYAYADLTNDGVSEIVLPLGLIHVFGCQEGHYKDLLTVGPTDILTPRIGGIADLNKDGLPELLTKSYSCGSGACLDVAVWSWTGAEFRSLVSPDYSYFGISGGTRDGRPEMRIEDSDRDGFSEVLLIGGISTFGDYAYEGPWRVETIIFAWDGAFISPRESYYSAPEYRFQALEDADRALNHGDYAAALAGYQAVINDDTLDWWSPAKKENWTANAETIWTGDPTPTPLPGDGGLERTQLSAYAYFRLALLHLLQGQATEAQAAYDTLQAQYAASAAGQPYAELGAAFWSAYTADQSIPVGCAAAQAYAAAHPDLLTPLGSAYHGWQSPTYSPAMICPVS